VRFSFQHLFGATICRSLPLEGDPGEDHLGSRAHQGRHMGPEALELASLGAGLQAPLSKLPHSEGGGVTMT